MVKDIRIIYTLADATNYFEAGGIYVVVQSLYEQQLKKLKRKEQECEELKDKLNCCFCNPHVELNDTEKLQKCLEVTECFRRQLDQLKVENEKLRKEVQSLKLETGRVCE